MKDANDTSFVPTPLTTKHRRAGTRQWTGRAGNRTDAEADRIENDQNGRRALAAMDRAALRKRLDKQYDFAWPEQWSTDRENRVLPGLYIGGLEAARAGQHYDLTVNLSGIETRNTASLVGSGAYIAWPIGDGAQLPDLDTLWRIARTVADTLRSSKTSRVLVHCAAGINRSALMCAVVVMLMRNTNGHAAMATVRRARRGALANTTFAAFLAGHGRPTKRRGQGGIYWPTAPKPELVAGQEPGGWYIGQKPVSK